VCMDQLNKTITFWRGLALAVCMVIGTGLLGLPGITLESGDIYSAAGGWIVIAVAMVPLIFIFTRLGMRYSSSAGLSKYAEAAVGGWGRHAVSAVLCGTFSIAIPAMALIGAAYIQAFLNLPVASVHLVAIGILAFLTAVNLIGVKFVSMLNYASLIILLVLLIAIIIFNLSFVQAGLDIFISTVKGQGHLEYSGLWHSSALLFWAFLGWENLSFGLEEFNNPQKTIPRVFWFSFLLVVLLYFGLAVTSIGADASGISVRGASGLVSLVNRTPLIHLLTFIMILVILANDNAWVFGASRLIYASGRDGILPAWLGRLSKRGIPANSLIAMFLVSSFFIALSYAVPQFTLSTIILLVNQNFLVLYAFSILAYYKIESSLASKIITMLAIISSGFLLSGFSWWIIYPIVLLLIGYTSFCRALNGEKTPAT